MAVPRGGRRPIWDTYLKEIGFSLAVTAGERVLSLGGRYWVWSVEKRAIMAAPPTSSFAVTSQVRRHLDRTDADASGQVWTGPDGQLYRASTTFDAEDDAIAWLSVRRAEIQMEVWAPDVASHGATRVTHLPGLRRPLAGEAQDQGSRAADHAPVGNTGCCSTSSSSDLRRPAHRPDHQRERQRLVRRARARPGDDPGTVVQPAAHHLRERGLGAADSDHPVQPGPHPRCRWHQARTSGAARDAGGAGDADARLHG